MRVYVRVHAGDYSCSVRGSELYINILMCNRIDPDLRKIHAIVRAVASNCGVRLASDTGEGVNFNFDL